MKESKLKEYLVIAVESAIDDGDLFFGNTEDEQEEAIDMLEAFVKELKAK